MGQSKMTHQKHLIGIDEAGRGPLAGPVALGAVMIRAARLRRARQIFGSIKNSKQLSPAKRVYWYRLMIEEKYRGTLEFTWAYSDNSAIDRRGIVWSIKSALNRSLKRLEKIEKSLPTKARVLLDGSLKAPPDYADQLTIIKGDEKEMVIAMASVVAKVRRDQLMLRLAKKYPDYHFETHKGYGTRDHYQAISKHGRSPIHRLSFLP